MAVEIRVPQLAESISEATVGKWSVKAGDSVARDQLLVELETDKVTVEVNAQEAGTWTKCWPRKAPPCRSATCSPR